MSEEQLKAFIAKVQEDSSLQEQLMAEDADPIAIAKAAGFTIEYPGLQDYLLHQASELSDEDLEAVAGGSARCPQQGGLNTATLAATAGTVVVASAIVVIK